MADQLPQSVKSYDADKQVFVVDQNKLATDKKRRATLAAKKEQKEAQLARIDAITDQIIDEAMARKKEIGKKADEVIVKILDGKETIGTAHGYAVDSALVAACRLGMQRAGLLTEQQEVKHTGLMGVIQLPPKDEE